MSNIPTTPVRQPIDGAPSAPNTTGQQRDRVPSDLMVQVPPPPNTDPRGSSLYRNALLGVRPPVPVVQGIQGSTSTSPSLGQALQAQQQALLSTMSSINEIPHETDPERSISEIASDTAGQDATDIEYQRKVLSDERAQLEELRREIDTRASELRAQQRELEGLQHEVRTYEHAERNRSPRLRHAGPSLAAIYASPHLQRGEERRQSLYEDHLEAVNSFRRSLEPQTLPPRSHDVESVMINGSIVRVKATPTETKELRNRYWDKVKRAKLSVEDRTTWHTSATKYVLTKNNKLHVPDVDPTNKKYLSMLRNHDSQLRLLEEHMFQHDIIDVLTIVVPYDAIKRPEKHDEEYNLFEDYHKLTPEHVANSCAWYNRWSGEKYHAENMNTVFECLQKNTDETLWNKALDDYHRYDRLHQGGPLMFMLILRRQLSNTETAIRSTVDNLKKLRIRDVEGEDVELVCAEIEAVYNALLHSSGPGRNCVPDDLPRDILQVLKSSSVRRFNQMFIEEQKSIEYESIRTGTLAIWTPIPDLLRMARGHYTLIKNDTAHGGWHIDEKQKKRALLGNAPTSNPSNRPPRKNKCFNCGEEDCNVRICTKPLNEARIQANRKKFLDDKKKAFENRRTHPRGSNANAASTKPTRQTKTDTDGTPLVLNKNNKWVPDQKALTAQKKKNLADAMQALRTSIQEPTSDAATVASQLTSTQPAGQPAASASVASSGADIQIARVQAAVDAAFGNPNR